MAEQQQQANNTIQLDTMSLEQLHQLQQREESRLQAFGQRYTVLTTATARLHSSQKAVEQLVPGQGFVPLTESLYVPAMIECQNEEESDNPNKELLVELGTGFHVEKTQAETMDFLGRKLKLVEANSDNVKGAIQQTQNNLNSIKMAMQGKLLEIQARQAGARHRDALENE